MTAGQRTQQIFQRVNQLASVSEIENGVARTFGTAKFIEGRNLVQQWMQEAGLQTFTDNIGNLHGIFKSDNLTAKTFVIGSHIDTVINAGKFDGPLGVIMGIDIIGNLLAKKGNLNANIQLIAFSDEEGVRFHSTYLGSSVVAGCFNKNLLDRQDASGITLKQAMENIGGNAEQLLSDSINPQDWLGYFEMHIEQGPVLWQNNIPVAVVTAIAGQKRVQVIFTGVAGHAGTVPMHLRQDSFCAAAEFNIALENYALSNKDKLVATIGKLNVENSASNVVPGKVVFTIDVRSSDEVFLEQAYNHLQNICAVICKKRNIQLDWQLVQTTAPVSCSTDMQTSLKKSIHNNGLPVVELVSGAGHDAVPISTVSPVSMMFIRCFEGISHNPLENVESKDIEQALTVADDFVKEIVCYNIINC